MSTSNTTKKKKVKKNKNIKDQEERQKHLDNYEAVDDLLFGSDSTDGLNGYFILKAFNERLPFKFIKEDPFYLKGLIQEWSIEEIEIPLKSETKDLINRQYLFR